MDAITTVPVPVNEPVRTYAPASAERSSLEVRLKELAGADPVELTAGIGAERRMGGGEAFDVTMSSDHRHVLGRAATSNQADAKAAVSAACATRRDSAAISSTTGRRSISAPPTSCPGRGGTR